MKKIVLATMFMIALLLTSCNARVAISEASASESVVSDQTASQAPLLKLTLQNTIPFDAPKWSTLRYAVDEQSMAWFQCAAMTGDHFSIMALQKIYDSRQKPELFDPAPKGTTIPVDLIEAMQRSLFSEDIVDYLIINCPRLKMVSAEQVLAFRFTEDASEAIDFLNAEEMMESYTEQHLLSSILSDLDHDGSEELLLYYDNPGSAGYADVCVLRKNAQNEYGIIFKSGRNSEDIYRYNCFFLKRNSCWYMIVVDFDYSFKRIEGIKIYSFKNGKPFECVQIAKRNLNSEVLQFGDYAEHQEMLNSCRADAKNILDYANGANSELYKKGGNAADYQYSEKGIFGSIQLKVDLNNDGADEDLNAYVFLPSNTLQIELKEQWYVNENKDAVMEFGDTGDEWLLHQMWFEKHNGRTYTYRLIRHIGTQLFMLNIFDVQDSDAECVLSLFMYYKSAYKIEVKSTS